MGTWVSIRGVWHPANERAYNERTDEIYEGKDRSAMDTLKEKNVQTLGQDAIKDPDNIMRARQLGMSVEEYLGLNNLNIEDQKKEAEEKMKITTTHQRGRPKKGVTPSGGGVTMKGGFGEMPA